jgi:hypothetical protein
MRSPRPDSPALAPAHNAADPSAHTPAYTPARNPGNGSASRPYGRLTLGGDPTELHRHHAHCAAARNQLHGLQSAVEAVDAFLSPRFFSIVAVLGAAALLLYGFGA